MSTYVPVPVLQTNVPPFLFNRSMVQFIHKFIDWATVEYVTAIEYNRSRGKARDVMLIEKHFNPQKIAAMMPEFKNICSLMTADVWNSLTIQQRRFLNQAHEISFSQKQQRVQ